MKKCKWSGDMSDEYCKSCNGITMEVDGNSISCIKCAGYEAGNEDIQNEFMNVPEEELPFEPDEDNSTIKEKSAEKPNKTESNSNNTDVAKNIKSASKNKETINKKEKKAVKVKEEKKAVETTNDIKVVSMRYTSGATVKKGDNYFKFIAEEEWDVSQVAELDMENVREQLWAKLNGEVDIQIEELNNMN